MIIYDDNSEKESLCYNCPGCLTVCRYEPFPDDENYLKLINAMVYEINSLEAEVVRTRQVLASYLPERWSEGLRQDIFSNLSARFAGNYEAYDRYITLSCNGLDPMENEDKLQLMLRLRDGNDETTYYHLLPAKACRKI